jgi:hypothetical protein
VIFHSYISLPEGIWNNICNFDTLTFCDRAEVSMIHVSPPATSCHLHIASKICMGTDDGPM